MHLEEYEKKINTHTKMNRKKENECFQTVYEPVKITKKQLSSVFKGWKERISSRRRKEGKSRKERRARRKRQIYRHRDFMVIHQRLEGDDGVRERGSENEEEEERDGRRESGREKMEKIT